MLQLLFSIGGCINRKQFLSGLVILNLFLVSLACATYLLSQDIKDSQSIMKSLFILYAYMFVYGNTCLFTKRKRDASLNSWHELILRLPWVIYLLFCAGFLIAVFSGMIYANLWPLTLILGGVIALFFYVVFAFILLLTLPSEE